MTAQTKTGRDEKKLEDPNGLQPWVLKTLKSTGENLIILFVTFDIMLRKHIFWGIKVSFCHRQVILR